jgi:ABC-2 type transport system ATP-binding protein
MKIIEIDKVTKKFGSLVALDNLSFSVNSGEIFGFLGPNGAGKSTTLKCIMDFIRPTSGTIRILSKDSVKDSKEIKSLIGFVPSDPNLYSDWTIDQHIKFVSDIQKCDLSKANELKELLQVDGTKKINHLSTGNVQKVAIILALIKSPKILLLDEPTRGLDPLLRGTLHNLLRDYQANGGTILLSSHDLIEVQELCSTVALIKDGKLIKDTTIQKLRNVNSHNFKISFTDQVPDLSSFKLQDLVIAKNVVTFCTKSDLSSLLKQISGYQLRDVEITSSSLEDIFMELYK